MAKDRSPREPGAQEAVRSETQRLLQQMRSGEAWSHRAVAMGYLAGGSEGRFTATDDTFGSTVDEDSPNPT